MAERILRSPGVTTRELDLSAPGRVRPQGVPAGIIGTAQKGPAFVPITFATLNDFTSLFGETEGKRFGPMAVREWMSNARSGLYLRVLGIGDGKKSDSNNVVSKAGFTVGQNMRDKDNTAASQALPSPNTYASQETDGSAHRPVGNPYAGAAVADVMTKVVTEAGTVAVAADAEEAVVVTIKNAVSDGLVGTSYAVGELDAFDGSYILVQNKTDSKNWVFWLSTQSGRTIDGLAIKDGTYTIKDLTSIATDTTSVRIVDLSSSTKGSQVGDAIRASIHGVTGLSCTAPGAANILNITQTADGAGTFTRLTGSTGVSTVEAYNKSDVVDSVQVPVSASTAIGVTGVTGVDTIITITFNADNKPPVGSTVLVTMPDGSQTTITHATGSTVTATSLGIDADTAGIQSADAMATALNAISDVSCPATSALAIVATIANGATLPTIAVTNNSPSAPLGRTYFLSVESHAATGADVNGITHYNDYLPEAKSDMSDPGSTIAGYENLLRGVLMFPSGVIPGINASATPFATSDLQDAAYGTYATGKDLGAPDHKGNVSSNGDFEIALNGFNNSAYDSILKASFDTTSPIYLSKVFNTDPTKIQEKGHYLYAHYDVPSNLAQWRSDTDAAILKPGHLNVTDWTSTTHQSVVETGSNYTPLFEDWQDRFDHAFTPWIMSQELGNAPKKLFKFHMLDAGASGWNKVKISIANISKSTDLSSDYGSFDVIIRDASDTDMDIAVLQQFRSVNLNPSSDRYIARVIGDQNTFFEFEKDDGKQKLVTEGLYPNNSQYVRVEVNDQIESGMLEATALPIGFAGKHHLVIDGKALAPDQGTTTYVDITEPPLPFRKDMSIGSADTKVVDSRFYWGLFNQDITDKSKRNQSTGVTSLVANLTKWYPSLGSNKAWVGDNKNAIDGTGGASLDADVYNSNYFSLEKLWVKCLSGNTANAVDPTAWHEAVYIRDGNANGLVAAGATGVYFEDANGNAKSSGYRYLDVSKDFGSTASKKFYKFTVPMQGGWDGLDIFDQDKSEMASLSSFREMDSNSSSLLGGPEGPTTAAFRKGLDILAEKSDVDIQILATPGMRTAGITDYAIDKTEDRFDALYIMDMPVYDTSDKLVTTASQEASVSNTAQNLSNRNLDTSFAATYFPDLVIQDGSNNVVAPPSVAVLGALSLNDSVAHPWYAPAGFARGALSSTIETAVKLNRTNMDVLYESDINPITSFPQTGASVIVFGQKTMLQAQSSLDRVNVRRLLIDVRRKVRTVANTILFEPNREATLARFSSLVNPILGRIQQQQGLDRYKVVIDTTTTTQQDVENNTIRGKIFLQPTRSIEFISLDFVVTNAGAEI